MTEMLRMKGLTSCIDKLSVWKQYYIRSMFFVSSLVWDKEKFLSPHEELNLRPWDSAPQCSTTEPQRLYDVGGPLKSSCMT